MVTRRQDVVVQFTTFLLLLHVRPSLYSYDATILVMIKAKTHQKTYRFIVAVRCDNL